MVFQQVENSTVKKEKRENGMRAFEGVVKALSSSRRSRRNQNRVTFGFIGLPDFI